MAEQRRKLSSRGEEKVRGISGRRVAHGEGPRRPRWDVPLADVGMAATELLATSGGRRQAPQVGWAGKGVSWARGAGWVGSFCFFLLFSVFCFFFPFLLFFCP